MSEYRRIVTAFVVVPENEPIYSERATQIKIEDEAAGPFVVVSQEEGRIAIDPEEWPAIRDAIETMMARAKDAEARG